MTDIPRMDPVWIRSRVLLVAPACCWWQLLKIIIINPIMKTQSAIREFVRILWAPHVRMYLRRIAS